MTKIILAAAAAAALLTITPLVVKHPAQAQSVEVGPGGIRVDPDRRRVITATVEITAADVGANRVHDPREPEWSCRA